MSSFINQGIAGGIAGYGLKGQLERAYSEFGDPKKVRFVQNNTVVVVFDASLNESHSITTAPTDFAVEAGQSIADHIRVMPTELQISVVKTDTPIDVKDELDRSAIVAVSAAVGGTFGILAGAAAVTRSAKYVAQKAQKSSLSPSQQAYNAVSRLAAGVRTGNVRQYPQVFDVITSLKRYDNMCIKSMQVQRDGSTGYAVVFNITLTQLRVVSSQQIEVSAPAQPALSGVKAKLAEKPENPEDEAVLNSTKAGTKSADDGLLGDTAEYMRPGSANRPKVNP